MTTEAAATSGRGGGRGPEHCVTMVKVAARVEENSLPAVIRASPLSPLYALLQERNH